MRLRTALKIRQAIGTPREAAYTPDQKMRALDRYERTRTYRQAMQVWDNFLARIGRDGRAELLRRWGRVGDAFAVLMGAD